MSKFQFLFGIKAGTESFGTIITKTNSMFYFDVWKVCGEYRGSWSRTVHAIVEKQRVLRHPICICTFSLGKNLSLTLKSSIDIVHNWKLSMKCFSARVLRCLPFIHQRTTKMDATFNIQCYLDVLIHFVEKKCNWLINQWNRKLMIGTWIQIRFYDFNQNQIDCILMWFSWANRKIT